MPITVLCPGPPSALLVEQARALYREAGASVAFRPWRAAAGPVAALSLNLEPGSVGSSLSLLLSHDSPRADRVLVSLDGQTVYDGAGSDLPEDRRLTLALEGETTRLVVEADYGVQARRSSFVLSGGLRRAESTLIASARGDSRNAVQALFSSRVVSAGELAAANLYDYELVVLDGLSLSGLDPALSRRLAEYAESGAGSLLLAADGADFGVTGDAPALEAILPLDLSPRTLKSLPDLAMLILVDVSGSMFGDKLSLAKATGAETLGNLKPGDLVGMLLFSEESEWLYPFQSAASAEARELLAPLRAGGGTRLHQALSKGLSALRDAPMPVKHAVLISDGVSEPGDFDGLIDQARLWGISISAMAVGENFNRELLSSLSAGTGGTLYRVRSADHIPSLILEDRLSVSRAVFDTGRVAIVAPGGQPAGFVSGMARFSPREGSLVLFSSAPGDPLLASRQVAGRSVFMFQSDLHAGYSREFFESELGLAGFRAALASSFREREQSMTVAETADSLSVSLRSDALCEPVLFLAGADGRLYGPKPFEPGLPSWWTARAPSVPPGAYTALVSDRGTVLARAGVQVNVGLSGRESGSEAAFRAYRTPWFCLLPAHPAWLVLSFCLSLGLTLALRLKR